MSVQDVNFKVVAKVIALGLLVYGLATLAAWGMTGEIVPALRQAAGIAVAWIFGNLADCGMIAPNMESLKK